MAYLRGFLRAGESSGSSRGEVALPPSSCCTLVRLSRAACSALSASSCQSRVSLMLFQVLMYVRCGVTAAGQDMLCGG